jgi:hypothetical protein
MDSAIMGHNLTMPVIVPQFAKNPDRLPKYKSRLFRLCFSLLRTNRQSDVLQGFA